MFARYSRQVEFFLVYIREAHPADGKQAPANIRDGIILPSARTMDDKEEHATACVRKLDIHFPTLVDSMNNEVELSYSGWPDRLYLIGKDGRVRYKSAPGPRGFKPAELESAIAAELQK